MKSFKKKLVLFVLALLLVSTGNVVNAEGPKNSIQPVPATNEEIISSFQTLKDLGTVDISTPTVVEVPIESDIGGLAPMVFDVTDNVFKPTYFESYIPYRVLNANTTSQATVQNKEQAVDGSLSTYASVSLPDTGSVEVTFQLTSDKPLSSAQLIVDFARNVVLPDTVEISALVNGKKEIVFAKSKMTSSRVSFPETVSDTWYVTFISDQPLRINEINLSQTGGEQKVQAVRFLAQPEHEYVVYLKQDHKLDINPLGESGDLRNPSSMIVVNAESESNPAYVPADTDGDEVVNTRDNCIKVYNPDQADVNNNGIGDVCDDFDNDGVMNSKDNCPNDPNRGQRDEDNDGIGDVCDGEESRFTEQYPWIPWVGIGFAGVVLVILFGITAQATFHKKEEETTPSNDSNPQI